MIDDWNVLYYTYSYKVMYELYQYHDLYSILFQTKYKNRGIVFSNIFIDNSFSFLANKFYILVIHG